MTTPLQLPAAFASVREHLIKAGYQGHPLATANEIGATLHRLKNDADRLAQVYWRCLEELDPADQQAVSDYDVVPARA